VVTFSFLSKAICEHGNAWLAKNDDLWEGREILPTHFEHNSTRYFHFIQDNKFIIRNCLTDLE
jgi:hypothetical protein